jgi:hypothetical protein
MSIALGNFETSLLAELRLGLPPLFYYRLVEIKDDWGFVLKLHSFFEGTLTSLIQHKLRCRKNSRETLAPRDTFVSRVYLADRMKLLEPDYKAFLLGLNRLRKTVCDTTAVFFQAYSCAQPFRARKTAKTLAFVWCFWGNFVCKSPN